MEDLHLSYNIFHGNSTGEVAPQIQSTLKVPDGLPIAKAFMKTETGKKPLCDVGNTLANARRVIKSMPEACKSSEMRSISSISELKGSPETGYQRDEVFSNEADAWNWEPSMIEFDQFLDPVPKPDEDNYEDIIASDKDISVATIRKMVYLWEQYDIPHQSSWHISTVENTEPLQSEELVHAAELLRHVQELALPDAVPLASF